MRSEVSLEGPSTAAAEISILSASFSSSMAFAVPRSARAVSGSSVPASLASRRSSDSSSRTSSAMRSLRDWSRAFASSRSSGFPGQRAHVLADTVVVLGELPGALARFLDVPLQAPLPGAFRQALDAAQAIQRRAGIGDAAAAPDRPHPPAAWRGAWTRPRPGPG